MLFTTHTGAAFCCPMGCLDVPLLPVLQSARKNLSANVGRGYVGEPSPLVPFGISPYVLHFLSLSIAPSHFNFALSHRLRVSPFLRLSFILRLLPITGVTVSRFSTMMKWHFPRCLLISCLFLSVCLHPFCVVLTFFIYLSHVRYIKKLVCTIIKFIILFAIFNLLFPWKFFSSFILVVLLNYIFTTCVSSVFSAYAFFLYNIYVIW